MWSTSSREWLCNDAWQWKETPSEWVLGWIKGKKRGTILFFQTLLLIFRIRLLRQVPRCMENCLKQLRRRLLHQSYCQIARSHICFPYRLGADKMAILGKIAKILIEMSIFSQMVTYTQTFKTVDNCVVQSPGQVQISPALNTSAGKRRSRNLLKRFVHDENSSIRTVGAWAGTTVYESSFRLIAGLSVTDFVAVNLERLSTIDYARPSESTSTMSRIAKLGSQLLPPVHSQPTSAVESWVGLFGSLVGNGEVHLLDGDNFDYKYIYICEQDADELRKALEKMVKSSESDLPFQSRQPIQELMNANAGVFRVQLKNHPPIDVPPMYTDFEHKTSILNVHHRNYSPQQTALTRKSVRSPWGSVSFLEIRTQNGLLSHSSRQKMALRNSDSKKICVQSSHDRKKMSDPCHKLNQCLHAFVAPKCFSARCFA